MAKGDFYFPLYYQKILSSTQGWKDDAFGAYLKLLIYQFQNGIIPASLKEISEISPAAKKNWDKIGPKFKPHKSGGLYNEIMDGVRTNIQAKKENNSRHGKLGGRPKKDKETETERLPEQKPNGFENEKRNETHTISNIQYLNTECESTRATYRIEDCVLIALADDRWVKASAATEDWLFAFNKFLESQSVYEKNPMDYKQHFTNWRKYQTTLPDGKPIDNEKKMVL